MGPFVPSSGVKFLKDLSSELAPEGLFFFGQVESAYGSINVR